MMPLNQDTTIERKIRTAQNAIDALYAMGFTPETLNAIMRIGAHASRKTVSIYTALLALEDTTDGTN